MNPAIEVDFTRFLPPCIFGYLLWQIIDERHPLNKEVGRLE